MNFLLPKQPAFANHFKKLGACIREISLLFGEFSESFSEAESFWQRADKIEHKADDITALIIKDLNQTFITPFDREDIYALAHRMDRIIDLTESAMQKIYLYDVKEKDPSIDAFAKLMLEASANLDKLVIECFKDKIDSRNVDHWILRIRQLEDQGDQVFKDALKRIFADKNDPISVIKWKDVIEELEYVMDQYNKVSGSIVGVIVKSS